jgi:hypothetical protein
VDSDELELKRRGYHLEIWKVLLSILTPLVLVYLTYVVNNAIQERGALLKRDEQVLAEKQKIYLELGRNLNVTFVYVEDIGDFRQYTPIDVVGRKRETDRMFFMYLPYWSEQTERKYNEFMTTCFQTYNGAGIPAKINTSKAQKVAAYKHDGLRWDSSWDQYFTGASPSDVSSKYYDLVSSLLADTISADIRQVKSQ